jgi:NTE family protein
MKPKRSIAPLLFCLGFLYDETMKRALVLCGGGSLGSYEVGVWKYLREKDFHFDIVTGTSIGSINGAMVATGDYEKAEELWKSIGADQVMVNGMNFYNGLLKEDNLNQKFVAFAKTFLKNKGADISPLHNLVKTTIDPHRIKIAPITLGVVTTAYPSLKEVDVVLNDVPEEKIIDYLHASSACYPIFPIYKIDGKRYVDGGYNNNLPIDFAIKLGAEEIVAVLLHAIPRMPQHPEMMDLPFVKTVRPSRDTGSIMDFDGKVTANNMVLGYNDARKTFGDAWGRAFTFEKDEMTETMANEFALAMAKDHPYDFEKIQKSLAYENRWPKLPREYFIRTLEYLGDLFELDYYPCYTVKDFVKLLSETIKKHEAKKDIAVIKKHNWALMANHSDIVNLAIYAHYLASNGQKSEKIDKAFRQAPESSAIRHIFRILKKYELL